MKTLFSLVSILALTAGAITLDAYRLDAVDLFFATAVAVLFAFALNDGPARQLLVLAPVTPLARPRPARVPRQANPVKAAA
jgi:hypothetical protein